MAQRVQSRPAAKSTRLAYSELFIADFSGGLNVRDALTELQDNETPDCMNVVLDERGGATKRLGYSKWNATLMANPPSVTYESNVCGCVFWYSKADGKLYRDLGGTLTVVQTFTAGAQAALTDFAGQCYLVHEFDGLFTSINGTSWALVQPSSGQIPSGNLLATWQNKLWVASTESNLLSFCAPGDATKWDSADDAGANYIREGNDYPIVCLFGTSGVDVQAQPALLVGKRSGAQGSMHRVTDAGTGNYVTLDQAVGPAGRDAITSLYGRLYIVSTDGIFETDGQSALVPIGQKLNRLFNPAALDYEKASGFCAARTQDRIRFSVTRKGANANDLCLEYHPAFNAFTARDDAVTCYVLHGQQDAILLGASPTEPGRIWQLDNGGSDDGAPIASRILTKVFEPGGSYNQRLQHIRVLARGRFDVESIPDFKLIGKKKEMVIAAEGGEWDFDGWDDPQVGWGEDLIEGWADFWPRQLGKAFQVKFSETSTAISTAPPLLEDGAALTVGAWAVYAVRLTSTPLHPMSS